MPEPIAGQTDPTASISISEIHESLREVATGFQDLARSITDESDRRRKISNRLISTTLLVMIIGFITIFGFLVYRANVTDEAREDQSKLVEENAEETRRVLQEEIAKLQAASDPNQRITYDKLVVIVCDLDPSLCDAEGHYVGR